MRVLPVRIEFTSSDDDSDDDYEVIEYKSGDSVNSEDELASISSYKSDSSVPPFGHKSYLTDRRRDRGNPDVTEAGNLAYDDLNSQKIPQDIPEFYSVSPDEFVSMGHEYLTECSVSNYFTDNSEVNFGNDYQEACDNVESYPEEIPHQNGIIVTQCGEIFIGRQLPAENEETPRIVPYKCPIHNIPTGISNKTSQQCVCPENVPQYSYVDLNVCGSIKPIGFHISALEHGMLEYPYIHVSKVGLVSVLLRGNIGVEITLDRSLRLVDYGRNTTLAVNKNADIICLNHMAARFYYHDSSVEADIFNNRRLKIDDQGISMASGNFCYFLHDKGLTQISNDFMDLSGDTSTLVLLSNARCGEYCLPALHTVAQSSILQYDNYNSCSFKIHGYNVTQHANDDVIVYDKSRSLKLSSHNHTAHIKTHDVHFCIEGNWGVKMWLRDIEMHANPEFIAISDGERECGFNAENKAYLQPAFEMVQTIIDQGHSVKSEPIIPINTFSIDKDRFFVPQGPQEEINEMEELSEELQQLLQLDGESDEEYLERLNSMPKPYVDVQHNSTDDYQNYSCSSSSSATSIGTDVQPMNTDGTP